MDRGAIHLAGAGRNPSILLRRHSSRKIGRTYPAISLLFFGSYLTLLPEPWAAYLTCAGAHHGLFHPSEDLSEPPPLFETVAGRKYHDQLTGSWQRQAATACPADGWTRSPPSQAVIDGNSPTGGSSRNLRCRFYPFGAPSTNVIKSSDMLFSRFRKGA